MERILRKAWLSPVIVAAHPDCSSDSHGQIGIFAQKQEIRGMRIRKMAELVIVKGCYLLSYRVNVCLIVRVVGFLAEWYNFRLWSRWSICWSAFGFESVCPMHGSTEAAPKIRRQQVQCGVCVPLSYIFKIPVDIVGCASAVYI